MTAVISLAVVAPSTVCRGNHIAAGSADLSSRRWPSGLRAVCLVDKGIDVLSHQLFGAVAENFFTGRIYKDDATGIVDLIEAFGHAGENGIQPQFRSLELGGIPTAFHLPSGDVRR